MARIDAVIRREGLPWGTRRIVSARRGPGCADTVFPTVYDTVPMGPDGPGRRALALIRVRDLPGAFERPDTILTEATCEPRPGRVCRFGTAAPA